MVRIIPRLDIKGPNLVKGVHLEGLRVLGRPELFAPEYYQQGADEIVYIDSVASLYGRNNLSEIVTRAAQNIFVPLTVGGGIRSVDDIKTLLRAGADKVAVNTAAIQNPALISDGAKAFGSQCIVVSIQASKRSDGSYECLSDNARERTGIDVFEWIQKAQGLGAGEFLITSVNQEGTGKGYDIELYARVMKMTKVPVIAFGGAGKKEDVLELIRQTGVDAVAAASLFHYSVLDSMGGDNLARVKEEGNTEFLKKALPIDSHKRKTIQPIGIHDLKEYLSRSGVDCRIAHPTRNTPERMRA